MTAIASKIEFIETMMSTRKELDSLLGQNKPSAMTHSGVSGEWSVIDIIARLASCDRRLGLGLALRAKKIADYWTDDMTLDEFIRRLYVENRDHVLGGRSLGIQRCMDGDLGEG